MTDQYPARREKLLDVWATIRAKLEQRRVRRVTTRQFVEYAWQSFDVKEVTSILSSPQESYFGHKDILFAGLCAWVACPGKPALVKHAITVTTARLLDAAERAGRDMYRDIPQIGDIYIRIHQLGFDDIYYPIGGIGKLVRSPSQKGLRGMIAKYSFGASHANLVMAIYHYHRLHLSDKKRFKTASLNTASKLVFKIAATDELALKERSVKDYWAEFKDSVAFSYAASRLFLYEDVSLLDEILLGRATFRNCKHLLSEWFGQATFAAQHILMHCAEKETASRALQLLPPVSAVQIAPPEFDETQASLIETKFEKNSATRTSKSPL